MLDARAEAADEQGHDEEAKARARASEARAGAGEGRTERQHRRGAETLGNQPGGNLESCHGAGEQPAQQSEFCVAEPELLLPNRQHDVDQVSVAVVQGMRTAGDTGGAALLALGRRRVWLAQRPAGDAHDPCGPPPRHPTKTLLMNDITAPPCWFTPVLQTEIMPPPGPPLQPRAPPTWAAYKTASP